MNATDNALYVYLNGNLRVALGAGVISFLTPVEAGSGDIYGLGTNQLGFNVSGGGDFYMNASEFAPQTTNQYDLGTNTFKFKDLYLQGNIVVAGTVDGTDISTHVGNASAHHSSTSNGIAITPSSVATAGLVTCGGLRAQASTDDIGTSGTPFDNVYCADLYGEDGNWKIDLNGANSQIDLQTYLELYQHSGVPAAAAAGYRGYLYYDIAQADLVFCAYDSGAGVYKWYKVTATAI